MEGCRARIGLIYPAPGILDGEYWKFTPCDVSLHITRTRGGRGLRDIGLEIVKAAAETTEIEEAASLLALTEPNVVAFACTSATFVNGIEYAQKIIKRIEDKAGVPATTTSNAIVDGLKALGIRKVAVGTPYRAEVNSRWSSFLENSGFEITSMIGLDPIWLKGLWGNIPLHVIYNLAKAADRPEADGVIISCTGLRTAEIIEYLENDLGKPVVTANQATIWKALRMAGIATRVKGYGKLLEV